ncbi:MAG: amino-acid N-acetyltransferase [Gammaproteobacteria bacterium]
MTEPSPGFVRLFREASPYIYAHRGRTFVIVFGGEALADAGFIHLVHDLVLLSSMGIRMVVVHGAEPQIDERFQVSGAGLHYVDDIRVTDPQAMECVKDAVGSVRVDIEAILSQGLANSPMAGARIRVTSGNFITARPLGIRAGTDYGYTGIVRRVDTEAINTHLAAGQIVLVSPIGYSPTGEAFSISEEEVGAAVAVELRAAKLIYLTEGRRLLDDDGALLRELTVQELGRLLDRRVDIVGEERAVLKLVSGACQQGVQRVHLLERRMDGALLRELFTRDGAGTMVSGTSFDAMRTATIDDVVGIIEIIGPLEADGTLVRRPRKKLEMEIGQFTVIERDGAIIGCAAYYPYTAENVVELACLAVNPDYRRGGYGQALLDRLEQMARQAGIGRMFVLTTQTAHWFIERGFVQATLEALPVERKALYNYQRNSKVLIKVL